MILAMRIHQMGSHGQGFPLQFCQGLVAIIGTDLMCRVLRFFITDPVTECIILVEGQVAKAESDLRSQPMESLGPDIKIIPFW